MKKRILAGCIVINSKHQIYLLWRNKHSWYETPGGKINPEECKDIHEPTIKELENAALRELKEEVKGITKISNPSYLFSQDFQIPGKGEATAHKFLVRIEGELSPNEDIFNEEKSRFLEIKDLDKVPLSRDLTLLLPKLQQVIKQTKLIK